MVMRAYQFRQEVSLLPAANELHCPAWRGHAEDSSKMSISDAYRASLLLIAHTNVSADLRPGAPHKEMLHLSSKDRAQTTSAVCTSAKAGIGACTCPASACSTSSPSPPPMSKDASVQTFPASRQLM